MVPAVNPQIALDRPVLPVNGIIVGAIVLMTGTAIGTTGIITAMAHRRGLIEVHGL